MAAVATKIQTTFGGRLLYTITQKRDDTMFAVRFGCEGKAQKACVLSYRRKVDAERVAFALECHKLSFTYDDIYENGVIYPLLTFDDIHASYFDMSGMINAPARDLMRLKPNQAQLRKLYVQEWDSYGLRDHLMASNVGMLTCGVNNHTHNALMCHGKVEFPSYEIHDAIQTLDTLYNTGM